MKSNVGGIDKVLRIVLGLGLLVFAFMGPEGVKMWGFIGVVPLLTGLFNFCPLYSILGFNTCPLKSK